MLSVQPEPHELLAADAFRLRDLIFMMRKHQIDAAV